MNNSIAVIGAVLIGFQPWVSRADNNPELGESPWRTSLSAGTIVLPDYLGDDDYGATAAIDIRIEYGERFFFSPLSGIGFNLINANGWRLGPIARYHFGRPEDGEAPLQIEADKTDELLGLGDIDAAFELGGFIEYSADSYQGKIELRQGTSGGHEGLIGELEFKRSGQISLFEKMGFYSVGPVIQFSDDTYGSAFFDVDSQQSAASGLAVFDAGAGALSYGLQATLFVPLTEHVSIYGFTGYKRLTGDAADSSLVQERGSEDQLVTAAFISYSY